MWADGGVVGNTGSTVRLRNDGGSTVKDGEGEAGLESGKTKSQRDMVSKQVKSKRWGAE